MARIECRPVKRDSAIFRTFLSTPHRRMIQSSRPVSLTAARVQTHLRSTASISLSLKRFRSSLPASTTKWRSSPLPLRRAFSSFFPFTFTFLTLSSPAPPRMSTVATQDQPLSLAKVEMEPLEVRWMHTGTKQLALPTAPITAAETAYKAFSVDESDRIERAWESLTSDQRKSVERKWGRGDGEWSQQMTTAGQREPGADANQVEEDAGDPETPPASEGSIPESPEDKAEIYKSIIERARSDPSKLDAIHGVPVSQVCMAQDAADSRTRSSRSTSRRCRFTRCSGRSQALAYLSFVGRGSWETRQSHAPGTSLANSRRDTRRPSPGYQPIKTSCSPPAPLAPRGMRSSSTSFPRDSGPTSPLCSRTRLGAGSSRKWTCEREGVSVCTKTS